MESYHRIMEGKIWKWLEIASGSVENKVDCLADVIQGIRDIRRLIWDCDRQAIQNALELIGSEYPNGHSALIQA